MRNLLYGFFSRSFIVFAAISIACHKSKVFIVKSFTKKRFYASHLSRRFCIIDKSIRHFWNQSPRITYSSNPSRRNVGCMRLWNSQTSRVQQHHNNRHSLRRLPCKRLCSPSSSPPPLPLEKHYVGCEKMFDGTRGRQIVFLIWNHSKYLNDDKHRWENVEFKCELSASSNPRPNAITTAATF